MIFMNAKDFMQESDVSYTRPDPEKLEAISVLYM